MLGKGWRVRYGCAPAWTETTEKNWAMQWVGGPRPAWPRILMGGSNQRLSDRWPTSCGLGSTHRGIGHASASWRWKAIFRFWGVQKALQFRRNGAHLLCNTLGGCVSKFRSASKDLTLDLMETILKCLSQIRTGYCKSQFAQECSSQISVKNCV